MSSVSFEKHLLQTTIATASKIMKYSHIEPHPTAEDGTTRKVSASRPAPYNPDTTQSVLRRNARERNRVKQVNNSFSRLRQHIPQSIIADLTKGGGRGPQKKISKVDTLRIAVEYIRRLQDLLGDLNGTPTQQYESQNSANCDSASNSSFSSSICSSSSYTPTTTPLYYRQSTSPLPSLMDVNLQQNHTNNTYNNSTTLLSPVSLNSYSPPHLTTTTADNINCHSPSSTFNSNLSYDSGTLQTQQQQLAAGVQELSSQSHHHNQQQHHHHNILQQQQNNQTTPPHFDGNFQLKFEPYDNFTLDEEDCTPDDEEILDYISLWQQQ